MTPTIKEGDATAKMGPGSPLVCWNKGTQSCLTGSPLGGPGGGVLTYRATDFVLAGNLSFTAKPGGGQSGLRGQCCSLPPPGLPQQLSQLPAKSANS